MICDFQAMAEFQHLQYLIELIDTGVRYNVMDQAGCPGSKSVRQTVKPPSLKKRNKNVVILYFPRTHLLAISAVPAKLTPHTYARARYRVCPSRCSIFPRSTTGSVYPVYFLYCYSLTQGSSSV